MFSYNKGDAVYVRRIKFATGECQDYCTTCTNYMGNCVACVGSNRDIPNCFCKIGFYSSDSTRVSSCTGCVTPCKTCFALTSTSCSSCTAPKVL